MPHPRGDRGALRNTYTKDKVCYSFRDGRCARGAGCRFSHDQATAHGRSNGPGLPRSPRPARPSTIIDQPAQDAYLSWRTLLRRGPWGGSRFQSQHEDIRRFWSEVNAILDSDHGDQHQMMLRDISDQDQGHEFIRATTKLSDGENSLFTEIATSFLTAITHPSVLEPLSIDRFVGDIYSSFALSNGDQAIEFLDRFRKELAETTDMTVLANSIKAIIKCLRELLLKRKQRIQLHDDIPALLENLHGLALHKAENFIAADADHINFGITTMKRIVQNARSNVQDGETAASQPSTSQGLGTTQSSFPMEMEFPGGRHDNDLASISEIQIYPTLGEILSESEEYLPTTNFLQPHVLNDLLQRYIDSNFRLLRHDIFGESIDVIRELLPQNTTKGSANLPKNDMRAHLYSMASIQQVFINAKNQLEAVVHFMAPYQIRRMSVAEKHRWWKDSSRLEEGSLICLLSSNGSDQRQVLFLQVTLKNSSHKADNKDDRDTKYSSRLVSNKGLPSVTVKLPVYTQENLDLLFQMFRHETRGVLVDFHGLIPATFFPVLENLQRIGKEGDLAFRQWILPRQDGDSSTMPPPAYARKPGFVFSLDCITKKPHQRLDLDPNIPEGIDVSEVETRTGLDHGQCQGLIAALTREYAQIQGPPGTGKSYVGVQIVRVLLAAGKTASIGPILVICYTNHALDQFLKHLLDVGIESIIRVGGRSQASELEGKNLQVVSRDAPKTKVEHQTIGKSFSALDESMAAAVQHMNTLHKSRRGLKWEAMKHFLSTRHPTVYHQLRLVDSEGFTKFTGGKDPLQTWLGKRPNAPRKAPKGQQPPKRTLRDLEHAAREDVESLTTAERWELAEGWLAELREERSGHLFEALKDAESHRNTIESVYEEVRRRILTKAQVVGITTSGLAKNIDTLRRAGCKIVIGEEAAEIMEPHVISALMPGVEHFIQIGDHKQLRPQISNYSLSLESHSGERWQLDRSLFERRAMGEPGLSKAPVAQLDVQRRMRPEISQLIGHVYPVLKDHECVKSLPDVVGMKKNLFWLDHRCDEDNGDDGSQVKSHSNVWEVEMAASIVRHLVRQGVYNSTDIALLTPYTGQLRKLKASLSKDFEVRLSERDIDTMRADGFEVEETQQSKKLRKTQLLESIRVATVDNFQGEEAKVIIVSLVRSNKEKKVGFLRTENRINVLLSRAQHGMYLIGNSDTYLNVTMWAKVHGQLSIADAVGPEIALCCPRHPDTPILCSEPDDFIRRSPEGGCDLPCDKRLDPCGHRCQAKCHSDVMHEAFYCCQPCNRIRRTCDHKCPKVCGEECGDCIVKVHDVTLSCGHVIDTLFCHQLQELESIKCEEQVIKAVTKCGHKIRIRCHVDVSADEFRCPDPCKKLLDCGHVCPGACGKCKKLGDDGIVTVSHSSCTKKCQRPFDSCNHLCQNLCHDGKNCGVCEARCEVRCPHSACASKCSKACAPCVEKCTWSCSHKGSCTMPCAAPCDRLPCDERCTLILPCGHQCPSFCGEECPVEYCHECGKKADSQVDMLELKTYDQIDVSESPIVVLGCGHFFTGETLDGLMKLHEVYTINKFGEFDGLKDISAELAESVPRCPSCNRPIRQFATKRYNRVINRAVMDETSKKVLIRGNHVLVDLENQLNQVRESLDSTRPKKKADIPTPSLLKDRYLKCTKLSERAAAFAKSWNEDHKPSKKLMDAIIHSQSSVDAEIFQLSERMKKLKIATPAQEKQITIKARLILIKVDELALSDLLSVMSLADTLEEKELHKRIEIFFNTCLTLIQDAQAHHLSRVVIITALALARVAHIHVCYRRQLANKGQTVPETKNSRNWKTVARQHIDVGIECCGKITDTEELKAQLLDMKKRYDGPEYESITPEELAQIKSAMLGSSIRSHTGHWYNCENGHPFAIGECGMPMEQARCPECGAHIGGQDHEVVQGVTRAEQME